MKIAFPHTFRDANSMLEEIALVLGHRQEMLPVLWLLLVRRKVCEAKFNLYNLNLVMETIEHLQ